MTSSRSCSATGLDPQWHGLAQGAIELFGFDAMDAVRQIVSDTPALAEGIEGSAEALRSEAAVMTADLVEAKALLVRSYRPETHLRQLRGGESAAWRWEVRHRAGAACLDDDPDRLRADLERGLPPRQVPVGLDGRIQEPLMPWLDLGDDVLPWTVGLLRPLHAAVVGQWLEADRVASATPGDTLAEGEVVRRRAKRLPRNPATTGARGHVRASRRCVRSRSWPSSSGGSAAR